MLDLRLFVENGDGAELVEELLDWFDQEPELRGVICREPTVPQSGTLGAFSEVLIASLGSGGVLTALTASLKVFLSQPRRSDVRIVVTTPDGARVEVDAKRVDSAEAVLRLLLEGKE